MKIEALSNRNPITIEKSASLQKASELMKEHHVGSLLVIDDNYVGKGRKLCGVLTDRDIALYISLDRNTEYALVEKVMMSNPVTMNRNDSILEVSSKMKKHSVKRIPILNEDDTLYGILSADDLLGIFSMQLSNLASLTAQQIVRENALSFHERFHDTRQFNPNGKPSKIRKGMINFF